MRKGLRRLGWTMITLGAFTLYFLVYQLFGTTAVTSRAQDELRAQLTDQFAAAPAQPQAQAEKVLPVTRAPDLPAGLGEPFAQMRIPAIDLKNIIVEGDGREELRKGPGRIDGTKLPGEEGTFAIAGHRTTYGAPFYNLNELKKGDEITVETKYASFTYAVFQSKIVDPSEVSVLDDVKKPNGRLKEQLVLSTCHPRFSAEQRLIIFAELAEAVPKGGAVAA